MEIIIYLVIAHCKKQDALNTNMTKRRSILFLLLHDDQCTDCPFRMYFKLAATTGIQPEISTVNISDKSVGLVVTNYLTRIRISFRAIEGIKHSSEHRKCPT